MKILAFVFFMALGLYGMHSLADAPAVAAALPAVSAVVAAPAPAPVGLIAWGIANAALIFGVLFGVSEALSLIPAVQSNGVFQLVFNVLKALKPKPATPNA